MIEVVISPTGDNAQAETPEEAAYAARIMMNEAADLSGCASRHLRAAFWVNGVVVRQDVRKAEL